MRISGLLGSLLGGLLVLCAALPSFAETATFAGSASCANCHPAETAAWAGSDHAWALKLPDATSVLGNFNDASFTERCIAAFDSNFQDATLHQL